jgi:hypothetical protein
MRWPPLRIGAGSDDRRRRTRRSKRHRGGKEILLSRFVPHVFVTGDRARGMLLGPEYCPHSKALRASDLDQAIQRALAGAPVCDRVAEQREKDGVVT